MATQGPQWEWAHVGAGTTIVVTYLSVIPGFLPSFLLLVLLSAVVVLPMLLLAVATALVIAPPYGLWRLTTRGRRRRRELPEPPRLASPNLPIHVH